MTSADREPPVATNGLDYRSAGVDIDAGDALVEAIKPLARSTRRSGVMGGLKDVLFGSTGPRGGRREGLAETAAKSALRSIGSSVGREIVRGVLGSLLGGATKRRR